VALHRAGAPGPGDPSFDRLIVVAQPLGKPLQGRNAALRRPGQPGIQLWCLPLAHELGKLLGECDGLGEFSMLRVRCASR
jgi:hypothetical protein